MSRSKRKGRNENRQPLTSPESVAARTLLSPLIPSRRRAGDRAARAKQLTPWQREPSQVQPGSSVDLDDGEFLAGVIDFVGTNMLVQHHTLFPAMSAAENLTTVAHLIDQWDPTGKMRTTSIIALCRSALESASRAVWVLCESDRDERRNRALRITRDEIQRHKKYVTEQVKRLEGTEMGVGAERLPFDTAEYLSQVTAQKNGAESAMQVLVDAGVKGAPPMEQIIDASAEWIDTHNPMKSVQPMANLTRQMYSFSSGITHGSTWPTQYLLGATDMHNVVADLLHVSLATTEAAVILWETQSSVDARVGRHCPQYLRQAARRLHPRYAPLAEDGVSA